MLRQAEIKLAAGKIAGEAAPLNRIDLFGSFEFR